MDIQLWQAIVVPLIIAFLTLSITWINNSASISHQRTQRLRELVHSGAWRTVHPMVLVMDVREAFGIRSNLDARALRLALDYQDGAFSALKDYLSAREFVHVSEDQRCFQRSRKPGAVQSYGLWSVYVSLIALLIYFLLVAMSAHLSKIGYAQAFLLLPIAFLCPLVGIRLATSLHTANRLMKLPPVTIINHLIKADCRIATSAIQEPVSVTKSAPESA